MSLFLYDEEESPREDTPMFNDIMKEKFGDYHEINTSTINDEKDEYFGNTLVQIIHDNVWKDVWFDNDEIVSIVETHPDCLTGDELDKWKEICENK